jgi:hypothetical protein
MFSRKTILEIVKSLGFSTYDEIHRFNLEFGIEQIISGRYLKERKTSIASYLIANPEVTGPNGSNLAIEILEYSIREHHGYESFSDSHPDLMHSLAKDGFEIINNEIRRSLPQELPIALQEDQMVAGLKHFNFRTALGHYNQAVAAHARGEWASTNAQLRSFVEEFFNNIQSIISPGEYSSSNEKRNALARSGFFSSELNEYLFNGKGFVEGFWKRLHPKGSHPGLSDQDDSTFRLHLVILVVHFFLLRLQNRTLSKSLSNEP